MQSPSALVLAAVLGLASLLSGCAPELEISSRTEAVVVPNGKNLNGKNLNGKNLNGSALGSEILWTSFEGVKLGGSVLEETYLVGSELWGHNGSSEVRGTDFHQAELAAVSDTGETLRLRIRDLTPPSEPGGAWDYWVEYRETDGSWYPICEDDGGVYPAAAIDGWWDPSTGNKLTDPSRFTFACHQLGALGKCVEMGYQPWSTIGDVALDAHHQGCVRALRADYCGDGVSYTTDGKLINLHDGLGIQLDTEDWSFEAEWDAEGARCFRPSNRSLSHVSCFDDRKTSACGGAQAFASGALLITEMP